MFLRLLSCFLFINCGRNGHNFNLPLSMEKKIANSFFFILVAIVTLAFVGLILEFLLGVFWAVVLAIIFYKWYENILESVNGRENMASGLTLVAILMVVIIPMFLIGAAVVNEAIVISQKVQTGEWRPQDQLADLEAQIPEWLETRGVNIENVQKKFIEWAGSSFQGIAGRVLGFTQGLFGFLVQAAITLYVLFFFFKDGRSLIKQLIYVLPIGDDKEWQLIDRFQSVARATVKGSLLIAIIQGLLGGVLFMALGIPAAVLWGALMIFAALLPAGAGIVWGPIAVILFFQGQYTEAIILVVVGAMFIGLIDNLLRPRLVGSDTKMPDYLILLSTLGGLTWFGLSGFVLGPIIAAMFMTCWQMVGDEFGEKAGVE